MAESRFKELGKTQKAQRILTLDFSCEAAVKKERLIKQINRDKRRDKQGQAYFVQRCKLGDQGACEAVKAFDPPPARPRTRQEMEARTVSNCNNYGNTEKVTACLDYWCDKGNETACDSL